MEGFKIKSRIWIENGDEVLLGHGRVRLLEAIVKNGSLSKAARSLEMSYKKAWDLVNNINKAGKTAVVILQVGGKQGGGAQLTPYGLEVINAFKKIEENCWQFLEEQEAIINKV